MSLFRSTSRFIQGVNLFLRVLLSYKLHALRNLFASPSVKKERQKRLHARNARLLREQMIELRGVFIKIGQFMSSRVDILPEEYTDELSKLQDQVPPTSFANIEKRVVAELGPMDEVFSSFDEEPIASASLGQVHKACLRDGDCIVVKGAQGEWWKFSQSFQEGLKNEPEMPSEPSTATTETSEASSQP